MNNEYAFSLLEIEFNRLMDTKPPQPENPIDLLKRDLQAELILSKMFALAGYPLRCASYQRSYAQRFNLLSVCERASKLLDDESAAL